MDCNHLSQSSNGSKTMSDSHSSSLFIWLQMPEVFLSEILGRHTTMRVLDAREGMPLTANTVFVNVPGKELRIPRFKIRYSPTLKNTTPRARSMSSSSRCPTVSASKPSAWFFPGLAPTAPMDFAKFAHAAG